MSVQLEPPKLPRWVPALCLVLLAIALSVFAWWPMLAAYPKTQNGDGQYFHKLIEAARVSVQRYREFPHWNPYECGGVALFDNPQAPLGSPIVWSTLWLGTTRAIHIWYVLHSAIGFVCMWLFARQDLKLDRGPTFAAAAIWAFSGFHHQHYMGGHFTFVPFLYLPLALLLWRRAEDDVRAAIGLGVLVAWTMLEGGVYPLPHLAVVLAVETVVRLAMPDPLRRRHQRLLRIARAGLVVGVVGLCVGAIRFLPVVDQLRTHKRDLPPETDALQWDTLKDMFLARGHEWQLVRQTYVWGEYAAYVGPIVLVLAAIGLVLAGRARAWLHVVLIFSVALMFGMAGKYAPYAFLKQHVYPFTQMRVPSRFRAEVTFVFAAYAGIAVHELGVRARRWFSRLEHADGLRVVAMGLSFLAAGDIISLGIARAEAWWTTAAQEPIIDPSPRLYYGGANIAQLIDQPKQNRGRLYCWDEWTFGAGAALWEGDLPPARVADDAAVIQTATRTQNSFTVDVVATRPARIVINSVYDPNWHASVGTVIDQDKLLAVELPPGTHHLVLKCYPRRFRAGVILSISSIVVLLGLGIWDTRRRKRSLPVRAARQ